MTEVRVAVYRCYDAAGELLYIGATFNLKERLKAHARKRPEWHRVKRVDAVWYENRDKAYAAESAAIASELPAWNRRDIPGWRPTPKRREPGDWLTTGQAGRLIGRTQHQIIYLINTGVLPYTRLGGSTHRRISRAVMEEYLANAPLANTYGRHAA